MRHGCRLVTVWSSYAGSWIACYALSTHTNVVFPTFYRNSLSFMSSVRSHGRTFGRRSMSSIRLHGRPFGRRYMSCIRSHGRPFDCRSMSSVRSHDRPFDRRCEL